MRAGGRRVVIAPSSRWGNGEMGSTGTLGLPLAGAEVEPPLSTEGTEHHRTSTTSTTHSRLSPPSPKPSAGILTKFARANTTTKLEPEWMGCAGSSRAAAAVPARSDSCGRCRHTRVHTHVDTRPHAWCRCRHGGTGSVLGPVSASQRWRGSEQLLQRSSFSFRLRAALPSVIKIYQCEPKHLALHLLL